MTDLNRIEARINRALARIEAALDAVADGGAAAGDDLSAVAREQAREIAALRQRLERLQEERRRDAEDVSAILADLKPLLES
ncbi:MAG: hypothetical protein KatS3mg118_1131 [Paracoccaceae bacterium]|nr:MAG: hypothetical protein KatS3mg118_1131 [Paracoccaceae bacterium]